MRRPGLASMTQSLAQDHEDNKRTAGLVSPPCVISLKKPQGRDLSLRGTRARARWAQFCCPRAGLGVSKFLRALLGEGWLAHLPPWVTVRRARAQARPRCHCAVTLRDFRSPSLQQRREEGPFPRAFKGVNLRSCRPNIRPQYHQTPDLESGHLTLHLQNSGRCGFW